MLTGYLKILIRNFFKRKIYSFINIVGLAIGIASFIIIMLFVLDEISYDRHYSNSNRIYRVCMIYDFGGVGENSASMPFPVAPALQNDFGHMIERSVRVFNFQTKRNIVEYGENRFTEKGFFFADSSFFDVFDHEFIMGNRETAINEPFTVVITRSAAKRYFGDANPLGETLKFGRNIQLKVTGVIEDVPPQSHFGFDFIASMASVRSLYRGSLPKTWVWNPCWTYLLLKDGVEPSQLESQFADFTNKYYYDAEKESITMYLQKLTRIHLHSRLDYEIEPNSNASYVVILTIIAFFVLIIASINFMNLATATSTGRAREIGIRKVTGAHRAQLILQFLGESLFMTLLAFFVAILLVEIALPYFNDFTGKEYSLSRLIDPFYILGLIGLWLFVGVLSGIYPAFYISAFRPISVLRGTLQKEIKSGMARKVLVVFQFTISISLIVGTLMIFEQINYLRKAELGFRKDNIIMLQVDRTDIVAKYDSFKSEILTHTNILSVTSLDDIIGAGHNTHEFRPEGVPENEWRFYPALVVKHDFAKTFDIEILAGRDYDESFSTDPVSGMLISESMVKHLGWELDEAALGKKFRSLQGEEKVIGVFRDFQATSLHEEAGPFVLNMKEVPSMINYFTNYVAIRIGDGDLDETISFLSEKWTEFEDYRPFSYFMLEDELADLYKDEENLGMLSFIITILILFVAALGLFGLASFMAEKRTKEIGIRKVMGASTGNIFILLSSEFIRLILISMIVSWPVAYLLADNFFIDQFIVQAGFNIWILVVSGLAAILLTVLITMYRAYRAAKTDPAKTLKYE